MSKIDTILLQEMINKGFTLKEISSYYKRPAISIQYYARTRKMGRFKEYRIGRYDKDIIDLIDDKKLTQIEIAKKLKIPQSFVCKRYKVLKNWENAKKERFQWLQTMSTVNVVEKN